MTQTTNGGQVPDINMQWHRNLWAGDLDDDVILQMIKDPRISARLQEICYDETGACVDDIDDDIWDLIGLLQQRSALLLIGAVRYAQHLANAAFSGGADDGFSGLAPDVLRAALEISQDVAGLDAIQLSGAIQGEHDLVTAGAEVVAAWINAMTAKQSAAIKMRFDPTGAVLNADDTLDSQSSVTLLQACWQRQQNGN